MSHPIHFVGAGPGAEDLITLRGADLLARADVVLYAGSLVNPALLSRCRPSCAVHDSAGMDLEAQVALMVEATAQDKLVVRLHTGEPSVYGAIGEQMDALKAKGIVCAVTPGVSSVFAAAAALSCELTRPGLAQSVVLTRTPGRTPMPAGETPAAFARTGATLAFFLSVARLDELARELIAEGALLPETPAAVVYRASWPDERIVRGTLADLPARVAEAGITRQALVLVGQALAPDCTEQDTMPEPSKLYDRQFSHGYRNELENERFTGSCALWAFTGQGLALARTLAGALGTPCTVLAPEGRGGAFETFGADETFPSGGLETALATRWSEFAAHIFIGATGIAVRAIAPHLIHKATDPAVVCCPETGSFALPLVSGHLGGANRLARRTARITGGQALISTATDLHTLPAFDEIAVLEGASVLNPEALRVCNAALTHNEPIDFIGPKALFERHFSARPHIRLATAVASKTPTVIWMDDAAPLPVQPSPNRLCIRTRTVILGVGCRKGVDPVTLATTVGDLLLKQGIAARNIAAIATCNLKSREPALIQLAESLGVPLLTHPESTLEDVTVPTPSSRVAGKVGTASVAEAAALLTARTLAPSAELRVPKQSLGSLTLAVAHCGPPHIHSGLASELTGSLLVVGLGSGSPRHITPEVRQAIQRCTHIAGYSGYLDLIRSLVQGKTLIETAMRGEVARCKAALEAARAGHSVCMVCSGDPGVLAMAGLIYELRAAEPEFTTVPVAVYPGITAANLAAAALGAPLQNGFCLVSLSDLLVPADEVRANVHAAGQTALPLVLYNPAGRKRRALLEESLDHLLVQRGPETPAAFVREAGRPGEQKWIGELKNMPRERVDMSTLLVVGGARTRIRHGVLYEERGYLEDRENS